MNLFLGNYIPGQPGVPKLWELVTDYYLHNPPSRCPVPRPHYIDWCETEPAPPVRSIAIHSADSYWHEYYRPHIFTSFSRLLAFNINSTAQIRQRTGADAASFASPFTVHPHMSHAPLPETGINVVRFGKWFSLSGGKTNKDKPRKSIISSESKPHPKDDPISDAKKELLAPSASELSHLVNSTLSPHIASSELSEYESYVTQFQFLPSKTYGVGDDGPSDQDSLEWDPVHHPDYVPFHKHIQAGLGDLDPCHPADYEAYAALPGAFAANTLLHNPAKADAYATWLRTGRYRPIRTNAHKLSTQVSAFSVPTRGPSFNESIGEA